MVGNQFHAPHFARWYISRTRMHDDAFDARIGPITGISSKPLFYSSKPLVLLLMGLAPAVSTNYVASKTTSRPHINSSSCADYAPSLSSSKDPPALIKFD